MRTLSLWPGHSLNVSQKTVIFSYLLHIKCYLGKAFNSKQFLKILIVIFHQEYLLFWYHDSAEKVNSFLKQFIPWINICFVTNKLKPIIKEIFIVNNNVNIPLITLFTMIENSNLWTGETTKQELVLVTLTSDQGSIPNTHGGSQLPVTLTQEGRWCPWASINTITHVQILTHKHTETHKKNFFRQHILQRNWNLKNGNTIN